jgi:hypothetical protein
MPVKHGVPRKVARKSTTDAVAARPDVGNSVAMAVATKELFSVSRRGLLTRAAKCVNCAFGMATQPIAIEDALGDFQFPQREAAFFYGLFLRGHSAEELRRDIAVPAPVLAKWDKETVRQPGLRPLLERVVQYRQHVLAIFENLIVHDSAKQKLQ